MIFLYVGRSHERSSDQKPSIVLTEPHETELITIFVTRIFMFRRYIRLGISHDTSEFAAECIRLWWLDYGRHEYSEVKSLLLLCDCGGRNNARYYLFKEELQKLADELGIEICIAHYPPYTSKYNPIEHRLFPHVTRACKGVIFKSVGFINHLIAKTKTSTGLKVVTNILNKTV